MPPWLGLGVGSGVTSPPSGGVVSPGSVGSQGSVPGGVPPGVGQVLLSSMSKPGHCS